MDIVRKGLWQELNVLDVVTWLRSGRRATHPDPFSILRWRKNSAGVKPSAPDAFSSVHDSSVLPSVVFC